MRNLDMQLLTAFRALVDERNVTRAAARMNLSQPAMSRVLGKLRDIFADPLFIRAADGLMLTQRAEALLPEVDASLRQLERLLSTTDFDPARASGRLTVATNDIGASGLLPNVLPRLSREAPALSLEVTPWRAGILTELDRLPVDLALGVLEETGPDVHARKLAEDHYVVVMSDRHPLATRPVTLEDYLNAEHVVIPLGRAGKGALEPVLSRQRLRRHIAVRVPYLMTALNIVAQSNRLLAIPAMVAKSFQQPFRLQIQPLPLEAPTIAYVLAWHRRHHHDQRHRWARQLLYEELHAAMSNRD
ncbi:MAG: LysR family transcriptional regulator [Marinobacter sp.]|uniref:LysR family transcriptional regulator n=1 Tax=Marinobacter sp. TaxID=50741 RepID=UPI00299D3A86|nr:LysR family transcriptional regulator [Marinobacter sp.]MDX1757099.1 LysR family transcriptional regulator [Marinobacter sp.]